MADNITLNAGTGGDTLAAEDIAGVEYQKIKLIEGGAAKTTALPKAEDAPHASGDEGIMALAVRDDSPGGLAGTDGDYHPLITDFQGRLWAHPASDYTDDSNEFTPAGSHIGMIGAFADETGPDSVDEGDVGAVRMTLDRQLRTVTGAATAGGASGFTSTDLDETEEEIKASAGTLYTLYVWNVNAAVRWLQIFDNTAAAVTVGTTPPTWNFMIPGDTTGAGVVIPLPAMGLAFATALTMAVSTTPGTTADAPGANECGVFVVYK